MVLEIVAAVGGSIAFAKYLGPILYHECFAPTSDDDLLLNAGMFPSERSPLLSQGYPSPSPRADSLRLATELYDGHLEDWVARQRASSNHNSGGSTPAAITDASGANTPLSVSPPTPVSAASSYFDLRQPPLYINDVHAALERETKRRNSNEFPRANVLSGFHMASSQADTPASAEGLTMTKKPSLARKFSNQSTISSGGKSKPFSEETAWLTSSLVCLLHSPDLSHFFLSGQYLDEDVDSKYHRAVIDAFASTAQFFWSNTTTPAQQPTPTLDLSIFQAILKRTTPSATAAPTPLSSSPISRPASPQLSSSPLSSNATLVNPSASSSTLTGAQTISHLLRSLHVALNEGEYTSDQPTYLRSPYQLSAFDDADMDEGLRRHAGFLRNMQNIQEDSIVRDVFEGLVCVKTVCSGAEGCEETTARFEGFSVLPLPAPSKREGNKKPTLSALLKAYEKPVVQEKPQWCRACAQYTQHTETRKVWSLPSTIIFQLPSTTSNGTPASTVPSSASSSRTNSPHMMARRLSRSQSVSLGVSGALAGMTPLSTQIPVDFPIDALDLGKFDGEVKSSYRRSSSSSSSLPYDLSSDSGSDNNDDEREDEDVEELYDLFAVRECVRENKYRVFAKDPVAEGQGKWAMFDAASGVSREVKDLREVMTPNADLLFYRRREEA